MSLIVPSDFERLAELDGDLVLKELSRQVSEIAEGLNELEVFSRVNQVRRSREKRVWDPWSVLPENGKLMYWHAMPGHWYLFNAGGAGEIQLNVGMSGGTSGNPGYLRLALGFSFGGSFIPDKGVLGQVRTPFFWSTFKDLLTRDQDFIRIFHDAVDSCDLRMESAPDLLGGEALREEALGLDETAGWISFCHMLRQDSSADLDILSSRQEFFDRGRSVFGYLLPLWERTQVATRDKYGSVL